MCHRHPHSLSAQPKAWTFYSILSPRPFPPFGYIRCYLVVSGIWTLKDPSYIRDQITIDQSDLIHPSSEVSQARKILLRINFHGTGGRSLSFPKARQRKLFHTFSSQIEASPTISWTEEPGGLQSMRAQRAGHDWDTSKRILRKPSQDPLINKSDLNPCLPVFPFIMTLNTLHFNSGSRLYICFCT